MQEELHLFERPAVEMLAEGAALLKAFVISQAEAIVQTIAEIAAQSPFRHMSTPGGFTMSVAMTNCGVAGWVSDRKGYRYATEDPLSGAPWPPMPHLFEDVARRAAALSSFDGFAPDVCLINRYEPGARMTLHQDKDEQDFGAPIVSLSLGLPAMFLFGGMTRKDKPRRIMLEHGDAVVWGGPARLAYHGVNTLKDGQHPLTGCCRYNLTFRKAL